MKTNTNDLINMLTLIFWYFPGDLFPNQYSKFCTKTSFRLQQLRQLPIESDRRESLCFDGCDGGKISSLWIRVLCDGCRLVHYHESGET